MSESELESTSGTERLVLLALAEFERSDRAPAQALAVLDQCRDHLEAVEGVVGESLSEADLMRACRELQAADLVAEHSSDQTSPVGKGRPEFELAVDPSAVEELLAGDDRFPASAIEENA